ncbi:MAG: hypothetical protein K6F53_06450 [Lachnospiraceae bacterium]|nr:hypothetical protein [Lachnospiraceae bacterium]
MGIPKLIDIRFSEFKTARDKASEHLEELHKISEGVLPAHADRSRLVWECEEADAFFGKERLLTEKMGGILKEIDSVMNRIDEEASLLYRAESFNREIGLGRSY